MRGTAALGAIALTALLALSACTSSLDNGLDGIPQVHITESAAAALGTGGTVGASGITVTDASSGASVTIPAGAALSLDASESDDLPAVIPASIIVALRPISQYLAAQDGDLLTLDGLNLPNLTKVGALAILPITGRSDTAFSVTIPVSDAATGDLSLWHFEPDDNLNNDGVLTALPTVGHWRFVSNVTAASGNVTFDTTDFGQYLVTTLASTGGGTAPTVTLAANPTTGDAPLNVTFTATATDDGTITKYEWDFLGNGTFTETTENTTTHTYDADGQFDPVVRVTDNDDQTATATVHIGVGNAPPSITQLTPLVATSGVAQEYTATAADSDGTIAKYEWDFDYDGTTFVVDTDSGTTNTATTTFPSGTHTIGVRVTDNEGATATSSFDVVVTDAAGPNATLTADPQSGTLDETNTLNVNFTTTLSPDTLAADTVVYDFGDGSAPQTETDTPLTASHPYTTAGTFHATVTVTPAGGGDNIVGATDVTVLAAGTATATLTADPNPATLSGGTVSVDFTTVVTPATPADTVVYDYGDGSATVTETDTPLSSTHAYTSAGTFHATVTITPTGGGADIVGATDVVVNSEGSGGNQAPTALITATPVEGNPRGFNLDASGSTDPENDALTYEWEWDSTSPGPEATEQSATVFYPAEDDGQPQTITLTVTDTASNTATATRIVTPAAP
jgi:PKD repeat protein